MSGYMVHIELCYHDIDLYGTNSLHSNIMIIRRCLEQKFTNLNWEYLAPVDTL